jgi:UDP-N-acetylmuramate dehydrogenase
VTVYKNISLKKYNTFGLDYTTDYLVSVDTEEKAIKFLAEKKTEKTLLQIIGEGSNILFTGDFKGTILHPAIEGIGVEDAYPEYVIVSAGAGVKWDTFVEWSVSKGFGGLENLSLIPGSVGASPVQNIGAYGVEVKDSIEKVRAISVLDGTIREFSNQECNLGYRDSIFKNRLKGMYLITRVYYRLIIRPLFNLGYGSLKEEVKILGAVSLSNVRQAVINLRKKRIPDPEKIGNAGSFFKNPIVDRSFFDNLKKDYPDMPDYSGPSGSRKLAAGWLIDKCGWKGKQLGNAGVHSGHSLILVNSGNASGREILDLSEAIKKSVFKKFGIILDREVEVI